MITFTLLLVFLYAVTGAVALGTWALAVARDCGRVETRGHLALPRR